MDSTKRPRLKDLIVSGKERGYLTYEELLAALPEDITDREQIESAISMFNDLGIAVHDPV